MNRHRSTCSDHARSACKIFIHSFLLLSILFTSCDHRTPRQAIIRPVLSIVAAPHRGPMDGYSGIIEPRYHTDLSFRVLGRVVARDVNVGDTVKVGQRLAALDREIFEIAVRSQEAVLSNARAQQVNSQANLNRQLKLLEQNVTPQAEFDMAKQANEAAVSAVAQAQADLDKAREQLTYTELVADMDGVVTGIAAETGQTVNAGQTVISIASPELREAVVDLGEDVVSLLQPGAEFMVSLQISPDIESIGHIREIAPQADATTRTRRVRIMLSDPPEAFRLGATITAYSKTVLKTNIQLPASAILESNGSTFVWIIDEVNSRVNRVPVMVSNRNEQGVEIASGLQPGVRVVTAGIHCLTEGQPIRFNPKDLR